MVNHGRSRRYRVSPDAALTMTASSSCERRSSAPILAGCRVPWWGGRPHTWTTVDSHYETLRRDMAALFDKVGITRRTAVAA